MLKNALVLGFWVTGCFARRELLGSKGWHLEFQQEIEGDLCWGLHVDLDCMHRSTQCSSSCIMMVINLLNTSQLIVCKSMSSDKDVKENTPQQIF